MNFITVELKTNDEGGTGVDVLYSGKDERVVASERFEKVG